MKSVLTLTVLLLLTLGMSHQNLSLAQDQQPPGLEFDQDLAISRLLKRIEDFYVLQAEAAKITADIRSRQENGEYRQLTDARQFASQVTRDLREVSHDVHFAIMYDTETYSAMETQLATLDGTDARDSLREWLQSGPPESSIGRLAGDARQNFFFSKLEILDGNVGYLRLDRIPALDVAKPTVDAAMAFLANSDAVILDLRGNPGGVGGFIPYLISYFLPQGETLLYSRVFDAVDYTEDFHTHSDLPGQRLDGVPLYVLIDPFTGSAARNLAYTLQSLERATLVGEASGDAEYRGAHSASLFPLTDGLLAVIPIGRVINARTQTNWRERGVTPDVAASSQAALERAHRMALINISQLTDNIEYRNDIQRALDNLADETAPSGLTEVDTEMLREYPGKFGDRSVRLDDGVLWYSREGMGAQLEMRPLQKDVFKLLLPSGARSANQPPNVRFERDDAGRVTGFSLVNADGSVLDTAKKDES